MNEKEATRKLSKQRMAKLLQINNQLVDISRLGASTPKVLIDGYIRVGEMLDRLIIEEAKIQEATWASTKKERGNRKMSLAEIILREAEKLPWDEWQCIVKAMEFVHRKRADKLTLDDSEKTHEELMFHVEHY